jgi:PAS domain S-box-containing protein
MRFIKGKKIRGRAGVAADSVPGFDAILDALHDDVFIADGAGVVLEVSPAFEKTYGLARDKAIGANVCELEKQGYFNPSVTSMVLETGEKVTVLQKLINGREMVVTAAPVRDENGEIIRVISFSRDLTEFFHLREQYSEMANRAERYREELNELRRNAFGDDGIVAKDEKSLALLRTIRRVAPFDANVLLSGDSGVGKSMFAKYIHNSSLRAEGPFIEINCGAIPGNLLESELFGYEKGSFTGANREGKLGRIELARNGTLFLDEIGELPFELQVKLLQVIQDKRISRVGGAREIDVDFRLITATNRDLTKLMETHAFRRDLYYRLNVISIAIPPLRERRGDIIPLAALFARRTNTRYNLRKKISKEVYDMLAAHDWPGNIRELGNLIERLMITAEGDRITPADLPAEIAGGSVARAASENLSLPQAVEQLEQSYVRDAYAATGSTVGVARLLGISQPTAVRKIRKYVKADEDRSDIHM